MIAPGAHGEGARLMGEAIRSAIGTHYSDSGTPAPSASVGWAVFPEDGEDVESLIRSRRRAHAEQQAKRAKGSFWKPFGISLINNKRLDCWISRL